MGGENIAVKIGAKLVVVEGMQRLLGRDPHLVRSSKGRWFPQVCFSAGVFSLSVDFLSSLSMQKL